ncbi:c-type cytochrome [Actibacterium ureilyticum]|uniref:c-type cytochrome n=1 Tax=Actibacterium ureilyticum TaxID=1590614 RepID=UPI000BAAD0EF|nr:c-type cytochrome [Actibacterium ureilyticum]
MRSALAILIWLCAGAVAAQEFTTLKGHGGPIMDIAVSPTGQVATASFDNSVGLWDGRTPRWLEGHDAAVTCLAMPEKDLVLSGGDDFRVVLQHPELEQPILITRHKGKISDVAVNSTSEQIASASWDGSIHLMRVVQLLQTIGAPPVDFITEELLGHKSGVNAVAFAPAGELFSASSDGTIRAWEGQSGALNSRLVATHGFGINELIVTDEWIAYGAVDGGTRVIDPETGAQIADFTLDRRPILSMAYHAETAQLAVGDGQGYIMMVDTHDWRITRDFHATRAGPVWALAFSPDGQVIYAGGLDDVAYAWPVAILDKFDPAIDGERSFLRAADTMSNGERQFMRKCSICHALDPAPSRKAGPTLHGLFGRRAGTVPDYPYSPTLRDADIVWNADTVNALFDQGPDHYIPGSKMPMQVIRGTDDRADLIDYLKQATKKE